MTVHVLHYYYDLPDIGGNAIIGVYKDVNAARTEMNNDASAVRAEFPNDIWDNDFTWTNDNEIHMGFWEDEVSGTANTVYSWQIESMEVQ